MDKDQHDLLAIAKNVQNDLWLTRRAIENISKTLAKNQPSKFEQAIAIGAGITGIFGVVAVADIIRVWVTGG
jgi:hypothetical protein